MYNRLEDHSKFEASLVGKHDNLKLKSINFGAETNYTLNSTQSSQLTKNSRSISLPLKVDKTTINSQVTLPTGTTIKMTTQFENQCAICKKKNHITLQCREISKLRHDLKTCSTDFCIFHGGLKNDNCN